MLNIVKVLLKSIFILKPCMDKIKQTLKNMLDLDHVKVDVHIEGIVKEKEPTPHGN